MREDLPVYPRVFSL